MPEQATLTPRTPQVAPRGRPRLAVVVGSGGMKCAAAVGMWKVLQHEGIPIDICVGCSGGSIYTAAMAMGMDALEAEKHTHRMWEGLFNRLHVRSVLRSLLPRRFGFNERLGLVDDRAVARVMRDLYGDVRFEQAKIPLHLAATDLRSGEAVELRSGRIGDAVRASIAIPMLLRPKEIAGRLLVDGGMSDPLPVSIAIREGADIILAMGFETPPAEQLNSMLGVAGQCISTTINHMLRSTYAFYSAVHHAEIVPLMPAFSQPVRLGDTHLIPYLIERGEQAMEAELPYLRRLLAAGTERSLA
ncbi:patatin-like phospholipase family protein [Cognatiluteimonas lumbrici]|uniref:patatin-like phospholipase family protein n=1 Tax=Cognatiluteimonas lumbrici TaxID=2559601 RepID=UPI00112D3A11|nr:patatin-like phospholipase family protein [Luteimonas lumbrici]